jgi:hypothetical protein
MNHAKKFHKATGPAFNPGEQWDGVGCSVEIVSVRKYTNDQSTNEIGDYAVTYQWLERGVMVQHTKDAWNFQVRYQHVADRNL